MGCAQISSIIHWILLENPLVYLPTTYLDPATDDLMWAVYQHNAKVSRGHCSESNSCHLAKLTEGKGCGLIQFFNEIKKKGPPRYRKAFYLPLIAATYYACFLLQFGSIPLKDRQLTISTP